MSSRRRFSTDWPAPQSWRVAASHVPRHHDLTAFRTRHPPGSLSNQSGIATVGEAHPSLAIDVARQTQGISPESCRLGRHVE
jgi:hypothetical protein